MTKTQKIHDQFDAVVVGAGTSGAAAALFLARAGLHTALVDERPFESAGARWVNGVPGWMFDRAGLDRPVPPELRSDDRPYTMCAADGSARISADDNPALGVDIRLLVQRLHQLCLAEGVTQFERMKLCGVELEAGRPCRIEIKPAGDQMGTEATTLGADLFVDASGMNGVLRRQVPSLNDSCPSPSRKDICSAAQEVCAVDDREAAEQFLEKNGLRAGETLSTAGLNGGFSIATICVERDFKHVDLLAGAIADGRWPSGSRIISDIKEREPWIGEREFGGSGAIPIRRPYDRFSAPGIALLGDAACQVFPAHASGTGVGLIAAQILAENVAGYSDPGSTEATSAYLVKAQRELGCLLASYDLFRRFSQSLSAAEVERMLSTGLINRAGYRAGLEQQLPRFRLRDYIQLLGAALRSPGLSIRMLPSLAKMPLVRLVYRRYPAEPSVRRTRRWSRIAALLFRVRPDLP